MPDDDDREQTYLSMAEQAPDSPLPWFSLGRYYLEVGRFADAVSALRRCVGLRADYAAALMALGEACAAAGEDEAALDAFRRCSRAALAQNHPSLAEEADARARELT